MDLTDAIWFDRLFRPYLGRYTARFSGRGEACWYAIDRRMDLPLLQRALDGKTTIGWYASFRSPVFGVDIDDHRTGGWSRDYTAPRGRLRDLYQATVERIGRLPSVVFSSPRGLHAYYLLTELVHIDNLRQSVKAQIGEVPVEIKPTAHTTLRVPAKKRVRDPVSLASTWTGSPDEFEWTSLTQHAPADLFGDDWRTTLRVGAHRDGVARVTRKREHAARVAGDGIPSLEEVESTIMPFKNGQTYRQTFLLGVACRRAGIRLEKAIAIGYDWLNRSPDYTGGLLRNERELEQRLEHIYEKGPESTSVPRVHVELTPAVDAVIERLTCSHPFVKQRTKSVRRFLQSLAEWKALHDSIGNDRAETARYDDAYPYYAVNRNSGLYPLPSALLERWNKNYVSMLRWLISAGVLTDASAYSPRQHVCRYYRIVLEE